MPWLRRYATSVGRGGDEAGAGFLTQGLETSSPSITDVRRNLAAVDCATSVRAYVSTKQGRTDNETERSDHGERKQIGSAVLPRESARSNAGSVGEHRIMQLERRHLSSRWHVKRNVQGDFCARVHVDLHGAAVYRDRGGRVGREGVSG